MNNKNLPVFIGATFQDLHTYRERVREELVKLGQSVVGVEYSAVSSTSPLEEVFRSLRSSQIFIGIFGMRYGSIPQGHSKSIVHMEYDEARLLKMPMLIYIIDEENHPISPRNIETGEGAKKLKALKDYLRHTHTVSLFTTEHDLVHQVSRDLQDLFALLKKRGVLDRLELKKVKLLAPEATPDSELAGLIQHLSNAYRAVDGDELIIQDVKNLPPNRGSKGTSTTQSIKRWASR